MWFTVEANDGDTVLDVADQRVDVRIQISIVGEVGGPGAARLYANGQRQGLPICVWIEREMLRYAVVGEGKVIRREFKDDLSRPSLYQGRYLHQGRAHGQGSLARIALLRENANRGEAEQERQGKTKFHNLRYCRLATSNAS